MDLSSLIKQELDKRGLANIKAAAELTGVSTELVRRVMRDGYVPKDRTLAQIARALGLDPTVLILAAHQKKMPQELRGALLPIAEPSRGDWEHKRKWPLSQEQCEYLESVLQPYEIQFIRKYRQLTADAQQQATGFMEYMFATQRASQPAVAAEADPTVSGAERRARDNDASAEE